MSKKIGFKRAKVSGILDLLAFLAALALTAGYVVVNLVKQELPSYPAKIWTKLSYYVDKVFEGVCLDFLEKTPNYPGVAYTVIFALLAIVLLCMAISVFRQGKSVLKRGGCLFSAFLSLIFAAAFGLLFAEHFITGNVAMKWYVLVPAAFFLLQSILKFSSYARAY